MWIGAIWLALWLAVFWARLIKTVWNEITKLNQTSAFSVALAAAITVIIASALWLPVSSTHIAIGWIFWIWFLKEYRKRRQWKTKDYIEKWMIKSIALAWVVTLPMSAVIASLWYLAIIQFA
jgi:PiT family inorganic phosphate transporter